MGVLVLTDPMKDISLETYTQMTPVPAAVIAAAKGDTSDNYEHKETGFSTTIGSYMAANLQVIIGLMKIHIFTPLLTKSL